MLDAPLGQFEMRLCRLPNGIENGPQSHSWVGGGEDPPNESCNEVNPSVRGAGSRAEKASGAVRIAPSPVSTDLSCSSASHSVAQQTEKRVLTAPRSLDYRPSFFVRSLPGKRTYTIGMIPEEIGNGHLSGVSFNFSASLL